MGRLTARSVEEVLDDVLERGVMPDAQGVVDLCNLALEGERSQERYEALERALARAGWCVVDMTTDDEDCETLEIVPMDDDASARYAGDDSEGGA